MSARSVPDELVEAAAEALHRFRLDDDQMIGSCPDMARLALQAAFAKLSECEAAVRVLGDALLNTNEESVRFALAALAREFGDLAALGGTEAT